MKVVVTGASGNLGTALLRAATDWDVVGIARRFPDTPNSPVRWIQCDVGAPGAAAVLTEACADADVLVHLAWAIHPRTDQPPMHRTNTVGMANVLRAAAGVRHLVCASSVAAYTAAERTRRVTEYQPCGGVPTSAYSMGKAALETQLDEFERDHPAVRVARIRPCGVTQADAADQLANWLFGPLLPRRLLGRVPVPLWPALRLQVVHADDVALAIRLIVERVAGGAFNLAAEPVLTARDLTAITGGVRLPVPLRLLTGLTRVLVARTAAPAPRVAAAGRPGQPRGHEPRQERAGLVAPTRRHHHGDRSRPRHAAGPPRRQSTPRRRPTPVPARPAEPPEPGDFLMGTAARRERGQPAQRLTVARHQQQCLQ